MEKDFFSHSTMEQNVPEQHGERVIDTEAVVNEYSPAAQTADVQPPKKPKKNLGVWVFFGIIGAVVIISLAVILTSRGGSSGKTDKNDVTDGGSFSVTQEQTPAVDYTVGEDGIMATPDIVDKVKPSVVGIVTNASTGSGFFISEDGYILTNAHVVKNATSITVLDDNEKSYTATLIGADSQTDVAVIKVEGSGFTAAELGDSDALRVGENVVAIGNPRGMELYGTVTSGIVSATNRTINVEGVSYTLIQTDASINSGNSGGALVNHFGQVIGITNAKIGGTSYEGLGFAIPINSVVPIANELIEHGKVTGRPILGISGSDVSSTASLYYGIPSGVYVYTVNEGSDAEKQGLQTGDVITAINGEQVTTINGLSSKVGAMNVGDTVTLFVYRSGQYLSMNVKLIASD